ncbi:sigma-70 family RNA polymerase sigma factor [Deltaproteobacteria bacterium TL4]
MDDEILIKAHLSGDKKAFEILVKKYQNLVGRLCYAILKNEAMVPDVVQDVFIATYRGLKKFRGEASFKTWIYKISVNESLRYLKKARKHQSFFQAESDLPANFEEATLIYMDHSPSPERLVLNAQRKQIIQRALHKLSDNHRLVLYLHYQDDVPVHEIAEILDVPVGSVKSRLFYARTRVKELLTPFFQHISVTDQKGEENVM